MEDKKQDVNSLQELVKTADSYRAFFANLADELSKVLADIQASKKEEDTWEMKCPYEDRDEYWILSSFGSIQKMEWTNNLFDELALMQGNIFPTQEAIELEIKRRNLLTRFRAFRDECNGDWKVDWSNSDEKWEINYDTEDKEFKAFWSFVTNSFSNFGYFKNKQDAQRAIELFGDEIKELFVEGDA